jgi:hypothetical protein
MKKLAFFILLSLVTLCTIKSEMECECGYWYVKLVW